MDHPNLEESFVDRKAELDWSVKVRISLGREDIVSYAEKIANIVEQKTNVT